MTLALGGWRRGGSTVFPLQASLWGLTGGKCSRRLTHRRQWGKEGGAWGADTHARVMTLLYEPPALRVSSTG